MSPDEKNDQERLKWRKMFYAMLLLIVALYFYVGTYLHM